MAESPSDAQLKLCKMPTSWNPIPQSTNSHSFVSTVGECRKHTCQWVVTAPSAPLALRAMRLPQCLHCSPRACSVEQ